MPAMTLLAVQWANVAGEEARQVLNELDFSRYFLVVAQGFGNSAFHALVRVVKD